DPNWSVKFGIRKDGRQLADWSSKVRMARLALATGNGEITQRMGRDPWTVTWRLWFACVADLDRMDAMVGRRATLRYRSNLTKRAGGTLQTIEERTYLAYPGTMLVDLTDVEIAPDGQCEATATFTRPYVDPEPFVPPVWPAPPQPALPTPLYYLSPTLSRSRTGAVTPTKSGAIRSTTLDGAPAWQVLWNTTNLCTNPVFGTNTAGWTATNGSIARTTTWVFTGTASGLLAATGANAEASFALSISGDNTISAYVRNNAVAARTFQIKYNGALVGSSASIPAGGEGIVSAKVTGTGTSVGAAVVITNSANGETFFIGHFQIEGYQFRTEWCPRYTAGGTLEVGDAWNGTPHASTCSRTGGTMSLAVTDWPYLTGAVYKRTAIDQPNMPAGWWLRTFAAGTYSTNFWGLRVDTGTFFGEMVSNASNQSLYRGYTPGASVSIMLDWTTTQSRLTTNGTTVTAVRTTPTGAASQTLYLVGDSNGSSAAARDAHIYIFDRPLTAIEQAVLDSIPTSQLGWLWG
ncbi:MAG: hypothetical protein WBA46_00995, partial [Thermomicrobiales bacterium]